ncbi:MAG: arylesterase [Oligoflexia bacterium]|nr:arylesterase [Oligoflexia bacterium]
MKFFLFFSFFISCAFAHAENTKTLIIIGDSLTEGYGIAKEQAYPALLENKLQDSGLKWKVTNSGVSGSTSASALGRVKWALKSKPDALMIALGANDGLRGLKLSQLEKNLSKAIQLAKKEKIKIFFVGMLMPPNYGTQYAKDFSATFPKIAKAEKVDFLPFLLEGVAANPKLNLADGIHPNEEGHKIMAETVYQFLKSKL